MCERGFDGCGGLRGVVRVAVRDVRTVDDVGAVVGEAESVCADFLGGIDGYE